ncbi:MAG: hypothetical protein CBD97_04115 [Pelagibacteraceae bacterium TMED237]|nr:MAG: hypothetical protein CBD97_04115 [Pelagibacteraceae bacterium TMED237]
MSLFTAYKSAAQAEAKEKSGQIGLDSFSWRSQLVDKDYEMKSKTLSDTVGTITDTLSLADTMYGTYESTVEDIEAIEKATGQEAEGNILGQMFGIGTTKIGDQKIKNKKLGTEGAKAKQQNMYREWEGNQTNGNFEISPNSLYTPPSSSKSSSSGNKQKIVSYEDALKNRGSYQDLLNQFHSSGDTSQTAWEALQS